MSTVITILVIVAVIWIIGAIIDEVEKNKRLRNGRARGLSPPPARTPRRPPAPPESFREVRRTQPDEPAARPARSGPAGNGDFRANQIKVDTANVFCRLTGKIVADCTCERCLRVNRNGAGR